MVHQLSWKVGGQQGEGIDSTGEIFATTLNRKGYHLYSYRHFSSRIKGGHTNNKIRVSTQSIRSISDDLDILVAFDQETIDLNAHELNDNGIIIGDSKFKPSKPESCNAVLYSVPFTEIAKELGNSLMKNMVAIGASSALLGLRAEDFKQVVEEIFSNKGKQIVENNLEAIRAGARYLVETFGKELKTFQLAEADGKARMFMIGNDAISLGALAAGVRFMAAYPITPASEIMEYLIQKLPEIGGTVIQTEDEMAAVTMAIGANYSGVRAFTASAGPGLSLMMEAIGLSGMTETPLVIVDTQRGGPSTGLPTKQEQSDLMQMIYGTHGEIPKLVLAPSTAEEAFHDTVQAFNLAEIYQCPVIILSDLQLSLGKQTVDPLNYEKVKISRGKLIKDEPLPELENKNYFKRYELTTDGVSPRVLPGTKNGIHHVTGVEHDETGKPSETAENRKLQMEKRMRKMQTVISHFDTPVHVNGEEASDILLIGFNSTRGAIEEAMEQLRDEGVNVTHAHIRLLHPFPTDILTPYVSNANRVVVVENNYTGQLANLIKLNIGYAEKIQSVLKYDGTPFLPKEVYSKTKELIPIGNV